MDLFPYLSRLFMISKIKIISFIVIIISLVCILFFCYRDVKDIYVQNKIIDNMFIYDMDNGDRIENISVNENYNVNDYLGYIFIPKYNIKRLIKSGTNSNVLDSNYVGMHELSSLIDDDDLIILAGHNVSNVFSCLHDISINDYVILGSSSVSKRFVVYNKVVVNEYDFSYLNENKKNELLLITCTNKNGERLLVMLKEVL